MAFSLGATYLLGGIVELFKTGVCLALVTAGLAAVTTLQAQAAAPTALADGASVTQQMRAEASKGIRLSTNAATGKVGFVRATGANGDLMPVSGAESRSGAVAKATAYVDKYARAFGATAAQLSQTGVTSDRYGWTVTFEQSYQGVPVFGSRLLANLDKDGDLTSVNGFVAPGVSLGVTPRVSQSDAAARAVSVVRANPPGASKESLADVSGIEAASTALNIYRMGAIRGEQGANVLAWVVEVTNRSTVRDMVFVDANTGKVINRYSMIHTALDRHVLEANGETDPETFVEVWSEGDAFPGDLDEAQQDLVLGTGESYWFFNSTFGRDSYDGEGHAMTTVNNDGRINCPNANWNGETTNYCDGVTADDTVAHEWAHAYTEYTSGLVYQWQSGAMNEAFSDIWGETVDMANDRQNETPDAVRPVGQCSTYSPASPVVIVNTPTSIAGPCEDVGAASYGPQLDGEGMTGDVVVGTDPAEPEDVDEGLPAGTTTDGCSPLDNAAEVAGKIVKRDRGRCSFTEKTETAENAGAIAVIIGNREDAIISPSGDLPATIPTVTIGLTSREEIRSALAAGETVNVTMRDSEGDRVDSYRWLSSEGDAAFGGAIRDMWNPNCYGDPGKVSDAQYWCTPDDGGGVHSNSGVVNHAYALLVDGATYNDVTVPGIGLDKAANIFWRTQTSYLTPTSNFGDLADGLASACADLTGQPINAVSVVEQPVAVPATPILPADCAAVDAVIDAVELDIDPAPCHFGPILKKNAPSLCGKKFRTKTIWKDDFQKGLGKWKRTETLVYDGTHGYDWKTTKKAPGNHKGKVAYDVAPDEGDCSTGPDDISSANGIVSPNVKLPGGSARKLSFQHYIATEYGFDGGNVKISVNGKAFEVVPNSAYVFNAPNALMPSEAEGNTSPLAGERGFTGTDGNVPGGSWGTSIIDLKKAGAKAGDKVRVKFELGRDGCGGIDGWYVDNVKFTVCKKKNKHHHKATLGRLS
jgi:Zn-dependent metalloprotease